METKNLNERHGRTVVTSVSVSKEFNDLVKTYELSPTEIYRRGIGVMLHDLGVSPYANSDTNRSRSEFVQKFIEETGLDSLQKIADAKYPIRLICKPEGSTAPPTARLVLAEYGMSFDTIKEWGGSVTQISGGQIPAMMREGRADIWFEVAPGGHPAVTEGMLTADLRMIDVSEKVREALTQYGLFEDVIPAETFPNQPNDISTVGPGTVIIASDSMPDDVAYQITKVICENKEEVVAAHASIKPFEPEKAWMPDRTGIPLHPGAERYYKEKGWMK